MTGLADYGWVYYPKQCYDGSVNCKVHLKLAVCGGAAYVKNWVLLPPDSESRCYPQYASSNDMIVIIPQAKFDIFRNPAPCLDFIGLTGEEGSWITNQGIQMKAFKGMIDRVIEPRDDSFDYQAGNVYKYGYYKKVWLFGIDHIFFTNFPDLFLK